MPRNGILTLLWKKKNNSIKRHRKFATPIIPAVLNKDKFTTFGGGR